MTTTLMLQVLVDTNIASREHTVPGTQPAVEQMQKPNAEILAHKAMWLGAATSSTWIAQAFLKSSAQLLEARHQATPQNWLVTTPAGYSPVAGWPLLPDDMPEKGDPDRLHPMQSFSLQQNIFSSCFACLRLRGQMWLDVRAPWDRNTAVAASAAIGARIKEWPPPRRGC